MKKWLLRILLVSITAVVVSVGAFCLANLKDEPLKPEVQAIVQTRSSTNDEALRGRDYMLGLAAPKGEKPEDHVKKIPDQVGSTPESDLLACEMDEKSTCPPRPLIVDLDSNSLKPCKLGTWCAREVYMSAKARLDATIK